LITVQLFGAKFDMVLTNTVFEPGVYSFNPGDAALNADAFLKRASEISGRIQMRFDSEKEGFHVQLALTNDVIVLMLTADITAKINSFFRAHGQRCTVAVCDSTAEQSVFTMRGLNFGGANIVDIQTMFATAMHTTGTPSLTTMMQHLLGQLRPIAKWQNCSYDDPYKIYGQSVVALEDEHIFYAASDAIITLSIFLLLTQRAAAPSPERDVKATSSPANSAGHEE
jgi:hypothetical protein